MLHWDRHNWRNLVFNEKKKFILSGPDGIHYCWRDLRKEPEYFHFSVNRDCLMVWGAVCYKDVLGIEGAWGSLDAQCYMNMIQQGLLPVVSDALGDI